MSKRTLVRTKTIEYFITNAGGTKKDQVVQRLSHHVNISKKDAKSSIRRAVKLGEIKQSNGILKVNELE